MTFSKKVNDKFGDEYVVLEKKEHRLYSVKHIVCGEVDEYLNTYFFTREIPCKKCRSEAKLTSFVNKLRKEMDSVYNGEYIPSLKPKASSRIAIQHVPCGSEYYRFYKDIVEGMLSCKNCYKNEELSKVQLTNEKLKKKFYESLSRFEEPQGYQLISIDNTNVSFYHEQCGKKSELLRTKFFNYLKCCPHCYEINKLKKKVVKKFPDYTFISMDSILHNECGKEIEFSYEIASNKTNANLCESCHKEKKRQRWEQKQKEKIYNLTNGEYEIVSDYKNSYAYITIRHNGDCGHEFPVTLNDFVTKGTRCPVCKGYKVTEEMFMERFNKLGPDYELVSPYELMSKEITFLHKTCGELTVNEAKQVLNAKEPCNYCGNRIKDMETANKKVNRLTNGEYEILEYDTMSTNAVFLHKVCGHKYYKTPSTFINSGHRCPKCYGRDKTKEEVQEIITNSVGPEYKLVGEVSTMRKDTQIMHTYCGCVFNAKPQLYQISGKKCPSCQHDSHLNGKLTINKLDKPLGIVTVRNYEVEAENGFKMVFPYALFKDEALIGLIDIRKEQHEVLKEEWGGEEFLNTIKNLDSIKEIFCSSNEIPLLILTHVETETSYNSIVYRFLKDLIK